MTLKPARTPRAAQSILQRLGPFELKDRLIALADAHARASTGQMLNAGRGNPDWVATDARAALFLLGRFALSDAERTWRAPGLAGSPRERGMARRLRAFLRAHAREPGAALLRGALDFGVRHLGFAPDDFVHELTDAALGNHYPLPVRMLRHVERIVHAFLVRTLCGGRAPRGGFDLFAAEGATAAVCYLFESLAINGLLKRGDRVALATPIFTPYVAIPRLERYGLQVIELRASELRPDGSHAWQYPDEELDKLADGRIKALVVVNPSNPPSVAIRERSVRRIGRTVRSRNPDLIVISDDVYASFVPGYRSLLAELPRNTVGLYSFSKNYGCTGWRLGVLALHRDHVIDRLLARMPARRRAGLARRYASLVLEPEKMKFIDRLAADSRQVAFNHTAGLSGPQQAQMALFALGSLLDRKGDYDRGTREIVRRRYRALFEGLGAQVPDDPLCAGYYAELDLLVWARREYGEDFVRYLKAHYEPVDLLFRLAEQSAIVLMPGGGFAGPEWSVRVSLANLPDEDYAKIGRYLRLAAQSYVKEWRASKRQRSLPRTHPRRASAGR
jgi:aspartate 4-decarboxylase